MTDEQWLWIYVNMALDDDDLLDRMCSKCREEVKSHNKCSRCGTNIDRVEFVNPNFDIDRFNRMSEEATDGE